MSKHWYDDLRGLRSLGSTADRPGSLAGLAEARRQHLGQFFTPDRLVAFIWKMLAPTIRSQETLSSKLDLFDNSVGSARLFQFADPERHRLHGVDVDGVTVSKVQEVLTAAGFEAEIRHCGMEDVRVKDMAIGLINPPFSVHLETPLLNDHPCTAYGKYGPGTSSITHFYAVAEAVEACAIVVAILPDSAAEHIFRNPGEVLRRDHVHRLAAWVKLPSGIFREEGTDVSVSLLVFDAEACHLNGGRIIEVTDLDDVPYLSLRCFSRRTGKMGIKTLDASKPTITMPVTGNDLVRVVHDGRKIKLKFHCGFAQARVMNAVLRERVASVAGPEHRHPDNIRYTGQALLDVELLMLADEPMLHFNKLLSHIREAGCLPEVDKGLLNYLQRRRKQVARERTPMAHWVHTKSVAETRTEAVAIKPLLLEPESWLSPVINPGEQVALELHEGKWQLQKKGKTYAFTFDELKQVFTLPEATEGWCKAHAGLLETFPQQANWWRRRAEKLGLDAWMSWDFQMDDLIELMLKPQGALCAWEQALGKARLSAALVLLSGCKHGLVATYAYLVPELQSQLSELPIDQSQIKVITKASDLEDLKTINLISMERLRSKVGKQGKATFADRLRRRIGVAVLDEGELLSNQSSQQTRAMWKLAAKRNYVLTGTPVPNYPRDAMPVLAFSSGDATAAQPFGLRREYAEERLLTSTAYADRGLAAFCDKFVTFEWATNEFRDTLREGAKREVPKLNNLEQYRGWLAPNIKRRLVAEPECARHVKIPVPDFITHEIEWDPGHLGHYLNVADNFSEWFLKAKEEADEGGKKMNFITLLARIGAVEMASNNPQRGGEVVPCYQPLTSKQRFVLNRVAELTKAGHRWILYMKNPEQVEMFAKLLRDQHGIDCVQLHGGISIEARTRDLNSRFKKGDVPGIVATKAVAQAGLNLPMADRVLFYDRSWRHKDESQAMRRVLRTQQKRHVVVEYFHLAGGIDEYQDQMVAFKKDVAEAGLDWAEPEMDDVEFLHLDHIMERFVEDLAERFGKDSRDFRRQLMEAA